MQFTKIYNARTQLLFCSLNIMFSNVPVAVAVVVFLNYLLLMTVALSLRDITTSAVFLSSSLK